MGEIGTVGQQIIPAAAAPAFGESGVADKDARRIGRIRAVLQIVTAPVQQPGVRLV